MFDKKKESEFNDWLDSIEFVDEQGKVIAATLLEDASSDPEDDRSEQ